MEMESYPADQVDEVLGNLFAGSSVLLAHICSWLIVADRNQQWLADGAADPGQWLSARFGIRHSTAAQLVRVARRLQDLPVLSEKFSAGALSLDQVDALSKIATCDTEMSLIEELLGLSNAALDRAARRANPPTSDDERTAWERRRLLCGSRAGVPNVRYRARMRVSVASVRSPAAPGGEHGRDIGT